MTFAVQLLVTALVSFELVLVLQEAFGGYGLREWIIGLTWTVAFGKRSRLGRHRRRGP
jgi:hypothetical protein